MKLIILLSAAMLFAAGTSWAGDGTRGQGGGKGMGRGGDPQQRVQRMQKHLGLSDAQVEQMREIRESGGAREDMRSVLTDEQRAKIDEHRALREERGGGRHRGQGENSEDYN